MAARKWKALRGNNGQDKQMAAAKTRLEDFARVTKINILAPRVADSYGHGVTEMTDEHYSFRPLPEYGAVGVTKLSTSREVAYPSEWCILEMARAKSDA
jgi:hypothetical protein